MASDPRKSPGCWTPKAKADLNSCEVRVRQSLLCLLSVTTLALLGGCGSDRVVTPPAGLAGEYALETVNGMTLPFLKEESASGRVEVVSGSLTLRANRTYSGEIVEQWTVGGNIESFPETSAGTFVVSGDVLTFTESGTGAIHHGTTNGKRVTATLNDVTFGFVER